MKFDIVKIAQVAARVISAIVTLVPVVEKLKQAGRIPSSADAREQVIDGAMDALVITEGIAGRDLVNDRELREVAGGIVDLVVRFHNLVAKKSAAGV